MANSIENPVLPGLVDGYGWYIHSAWRVKAYGGVSDRSYWLQLTTNLDPEGIEGGAREEELSSLTYGGVDVEYLYGSELRG